MRRFLSPVILECANSIKKKENACLDLGALRQEDWRKRLLWESATTDCPPQGRVVKINTQRCGLQTSRTELLLEQSQGLYTPEPANQSSLHCSGTSTRAVLPDGGNPEPSHHLGWYRHTAACPDGGDIWTRGNLDSASQCHVPAASEEIPTPGGGPQNHGGACSQGESHRPHLWMRSVPKIWEMIYNNLTQKNVYLQACGPHLRCQHLKEQARSERNQLNQCTDHA